MNKKTIPYERVVKITEKLEKAMKTQDKELFNKWYSIAKKEKEPKFFNSIFIKNIKEMASKPNNDFFNFLIKEVKNEFKTENLRDVILRIMGSNQVANYHAIQEAWGKDFYNDDFFQSKTASSLISSYYIHGFSYDFENILNLTKVNIIADYCKSIHVDEIEKKDMVHLLFNKLPLAEKTLSLAHNLQKSIENNKPENIEFFCFKLVNECKINKDLRDELLIASLVQSIRKKDETLYMSYKQKKEAEEYKAQLKEVVNGSLTDEMLTSGGQHFKFLLDKIELKEKLDLLPQAQRVIKKNKI
jgi:hypothetical protein